MEVLYSFSFLKSSWKVPLHPLPFSETRVSLCNSGTPQIHRSTCVSASQVVGGSQCFQGFMLCLQPVPTPDTRAISTLNKFSEDILASSSCWEAKEWGHIPASYPSMDASCGLLAADNREPAFQTHYAVWRWTGWYLQSQCLRGEMWQWHNHGWHLLGFKQGKHLSRRKNPGWPLIVYHYWQIRALLPRYAAIQDTHQRSQKGLLVSIHVLLVLLSYLKSSR